MSTRYTYLEAITGNHTDGIYRAIDAETGKTVAIKQLNNIDISNDVKFLTDTNYLSGTQHANIATVIDIIENEVGCSLVMEDIEGKPLPDYIANGPLTGDEFHTLATQLLSAVATAHQEGVIHGRLTPRNLIIKRCENGKLELKVINFSIPNSAIEQNQVFPQQRYFIAPELVEDENTTEASDIYSLGCLFYYMLTSSIPFKGSSLESVAESCQNTQHSQLSDFRQDLPVLIQHWLDSHLKFSPEQRISSCALSLNKLLAAISHDKTEKKHVPRPRIAEKTDFVVSKSSVSPPPLPAFTTHQENEFAKHKKKQSHTPNKPRSIHQNTLAQNPDTLWYFSINEQRKGPINFDKLCELVKSGTIRKTDMLWHPRLGEWTSACEIDELHDELDAGATLPPVTPPSKRIFVSNAPVIPDDYNDKKATFCRRIISADSVILMISSLTALVYMYFMPQQWQQALLTLSLVNCVAAIVISRWRMARQGALWFIFGLILPIISDCTFGVLKSKNAFCSLILIGFSIALFNYAYNHRVEGDSIDVLKIQTSIDRISAAIQNKGLSSD